MNNRSSQYACALIVRDNQVLLGRRAHFRAAYPNCWDFIGGKIETISLDQPPVYHFYKVTEWQNGDPHINNHEHAHLAWFTLEQACDLSNLALPEYRNLLRSLLK